jgi:hypothetical protein
MGDCTHRHSSWSREKYKLVEPERGLLLASWEITWPMSGLWKRLFAGVGRDSLGESKHSGGWGVTFSSAGVAWSRSASATAFGLYTRFEGEGFRGKPATRRRARFRSTSCVVGTTRRARLALYWGIPARFSKLKASRASWPRLVACGRVSGGLDGGGGSRCTFYFLPISTVSKDT